MTVDGDFNNEEVTFGVSATNLSRNLSGFSLSKSDAREKMIGPPSREIGSTRSADFWELPG